MKTSDKLRREQQPKVVELRALAGKEAAGETLGDTERARFETLETEIRALDEKIRRAATAEELEARAVATPIGERGEPGLDLSRYSVARAIRGASAGTLDGIEGEYHAELSRGRETRGVMVPVELLLGDTRSQTVNADPKGGYLVQTQQLAVADQFRPALLVESMGATVVRGLVGDLDLPNIASGGTGYWVGEDQAPTESDVDFAMVAMTPKTVAAQYRWSRRIMLQTNQAIEGLLRRDLGFLLAQRLDAAAIMRRDAGNMAEPAGILDSGLEKVTTETLFSDTVANCIGGLELDNVTGTRAFLTSPKVMKAVRKIVEATTNRPIPIPEIFHNERVETTNQVPDNIGAGANKSALICGMWSELFIGYWSAVDILLNPYHSDVASKGGALLHAFLDADVAVRHVEAFDYAEI